jgi:hypothetical protein
MLIGHLCGSGFAFGYEISNAILFFYRIGKVKEGKGA